MASLSGALSSNFGLRQYFVGRNIKLLQLLKDPSPRKRPLQAQGLGYWSADTQSETVQAIFEVVDLILTQPYIFNYIITEKKKDMAKCDFLRGLKVLVRQPRILP